jgi:hypothetical protein
MYIPELKGPEKKRWQRLGARAYQAGQGASAWATILAAVVAAISFYFGYQQFRNTQQATRETLNLQRVTLNLQRESLDLDRDSKAVELLVKYNDLMSEADSRSGRARATNDFWLDNSALLIAESIFKLRAEDESWRGTVRWIVQNHPDSFKHGLDCVTYDADFINFLSTVVKRNVCAKATPRLP